MTRRFCTASPAEAPTLARLNQQLIADERSRNPMTLAELETRMRGWLADDWEAVLIEQSGETIGYLLFQVRRDDYFPEQPFVYVRHFFIERRWRGQGLGRAAFGQIAGTCFPPGALLTLDVMESNPGGRSFWECLGFAPYATTLRRIGDTM